MNVIRNNPTVQNNALKEASRFFLLALSLLLLVALTGCSGGGGGGGGEDAGNSGSQGQSEYNVSDTQTDPTSTGDPTGVTSVGHGPGIIIDSELY
jgi:hypothetical protein